MTELLREKRRAVRRRPLLAVLLVVAVAGVVSLAGSSFASSTTASCSTNGTLDATDPSVNGGRSNFEIDASVTGGTLKKPVFSAGANLTLDGSSPCIDWTTSAKGAGGNDSLMTGVLAKADKPSGSGDDSFTQGTSEGDTTPTISSGSIPPNKSDLQTFGVYRESNSSGKFLDLFWSRINAPSGTVDMDFELNKEVCDGTASHCSNNGSGQFVIPLRSDGDRLITYDLANGGTNPTISIYTWSGSATSGSWTNGTVISGASHEALGSINFDPIATADGGGLGAKSALTFGEVSISYKALFGTSGTSGCGSFGSVFLKSRSSNTFTDELKDFVAPEAVQITNCTTLATQASNPPSGTAQSIGGTITDQATLSNAQSPTNGIVFKAYGPFDVTTDAANDQCDPTPTTGNLRFTSSPIALTGPDSSGNYTASVPSSGTGSFTPASAGRYEWVASYAADSNNGASSGSCGDANEQSIVAPVTPTLATTASNGTTGQALGSAVNDRATLTGTAAQPNGSAAGGSITFKLYGPASTPTCVDTGTNANLVFTSDPFPVSGDRSGTTSYGPASYTPTAAGTYYWVASYSGNLPNTNARSGSCGDAGETSIVSPRLPTISTNASAGTVGVNVGTALDDTAHLGNTALEPDGTTQAQGTITFKLYGPATTATCINPGDSGANLVGVVTISVNGDADYKASNGTLQSGGTLSPTTAGTYYWTVAYSGDSPNTSPVSEGCGGANESSIVVKQNSTITTAQGWFPNDTATLDHSGGTVVFTLFKNNSTCTGTTGIVYGPTGDKSVVATGAGGTGPFKASTTNWTGSADSATVAPFQVTSVTSGDSYYWRAAYTSGDAQHKDVTSCVEVTTFTSLSNGSAVTSP
jgi:hypothetical protein